MAAALVLLDFGPPTPSSSSTKAGENCIPDATETAGENNQGEYEEADEDADNYPCDRTAGKAALVVDATVRQGDVGPGGDGCFKRDGGAWAGGLSYQDEGGRGATQRRAADDNDGCGGPRSRHRSLIGAVVSGAASTDASRALASFVAVLITGTADAPARRFVQSVVARPGASGGRNRRGDVRAHHLGVDRGISVRDIVRRPVPSCCRSHRRDSRAALRLILCVGVAGAPGRAAQLAAVAAVLAAAVPSCKELVEAEPRELRYGPLRTGEGER